RHLLELGALHRLTVEGEGQLDLGDIEFIARDEIGPERGRVVDALALEPLTTMTTLQVALGNVVAEAIAKDVVERFSLGYRAAALADNDGDFRLIIPLGGDMRIKGNVVVRTDD